MEFVSNLENEMKKKQNLRSEKVRLTWIFFNSDELTRAINL